MPRFSSASASSSTPADAPVARQQRGCLVDGGPGVADPPCPQQLDAGERGLGAVVALRRHVVERALRGVQQGVGLGPARLREEVGGGDRGELGVAAHALRGQAGEQRAERRLLAVEHQVHPVAAEQLARELPVAAELGVAHRLERVAVLGVPRRRRPVQCLDGLRRAAAQLQPQQVGEQVVVAEPRAGGVDRDDQRVRLLELVQQPRPVAAAGQRVGERAADALEDACAHQQRAHLRRLGGERLVEQVVGDRALAAGEFGDEAPRCLVAGERQRGEAQARRPALGALLQAAHVAVADRHPSPGQQLAGLLIREVQVGGADLQQLAYQAQPVQAELRVATADDDRVQPRGRRAEQLLEPVERLGRAQLVEVVEDQEDRARERVEALDQAREELVLSARRRGRERGERAVRFDRARPAQRLHDRAPEARRVPLPALDPHPRGRRRLPRARQPRRHERRLAAARRGAQQRGAPGRAAIEEREQARTGDEARDGPRCRWSVDASQPMPVRARPATRGSNAARSQRRPRTRRRSAAAARLPTCTK